MILFYQTGFKRKSKYSCSIFFANWHPGTSVGISLQSLLKLPILDIKDESTPISSKNAIATKTQRHQGSPRAYLSMTYS